MTQRLKIIWIYLSHEFLPLFTVQIPHFDDNSVSMGASSEVVRPKKLRTSQPPQVALKSINKLQCKQRRQDRHHNASLLSCASEKQWCQTLKWKDYSIYIYIYIALRNISHQCRLWRLLWDVYAFKWLSAVRHWIGDRYSLEAIYICITYIPKCIYAYIHKHTNQTHAVHPINNNAALQIAFPKNNVSRNLSFPF